MRARILVAVAVAAMTLTSACGGSDEGSGDSSAPTTPSETPSPEPTGPEKYSLGNEASFTADGGGAFSLTVEKYKKNVPDDDSVEAGDRLDILLIKACNESFDDAPNGDDLGQILAYENLQLADDDSGSYSELDLTPSPAPKPQLAAFDVVSKGQCRKGWVAFGVPKESKILNATYAAGGEVLASWNL